MQDHDRATDDESSDPQRATRDLRRASSGSPAGSGRVAAVPAGAIVRAATGAAGRVLAAVCLAALAVGALAAPATAQEQDRDARLDSLEREVERLQERIDRRDTTEVDELRQQLETVLRQIEQMRLGQEVVRADTSVYGLAPAASKVYRVDRGVSIGGYGEVLYENFADEREDGSPSGATDQIDALRGIVYVGYKFNDNVIFNSEIEFEHATTSGGTGSASLEFAYLDYRLDDAFNLRGGLLLPPMGFINEIHEPPTFLGTERPVTESAIIPTTWRENGLGFFGEAGDLEYRAYVINSFDAVGDGDSPASGFSDAGIRGGRQKGGKALAEDMAGVGRVDWAGVRGLRVGTSLFVGETAQNAPDPTDGTGDETIGGSTLIWEGHAEYRARGFDLRGLFAVADVDDVEELNAVHGFTGDESIGEGMVGGYLQAGYDLLHRVETDHQLLPYVRWERVNTQDEVPAGFAADPSNDRTIVSLGAAWKPVPGGIVKADYQIHSDEGDTGVDQFNVALGWLF